MWESSKNSGKNIASFAGKLRWFESTPGITYNKDNGELDWEASV